MSHNSSLAPNLLPQKRRNEAELFTLNKLAKKVKISLGIEMGDDFKMMNENMTTNKEPQLYQKPTHALDSWDFSVLPDIHNGFESVYEHPSYEINYGSKIDFAVEEEKDKTPQVPGKFPSYGFSEGLHPLRPIPTTLKKKSTSSNFNHPTHFDSQFTSDVKNTNGYWRNFGFNVESTSFGSALGNLSLVNPNSLVNSESRTSTVHRAQSRPPNILESTISKDTTDIPIIPNLPTFNFKKSRIRHVARLPNSKPEIITEPFLRKQNEIQTTSSDRENKSPNHLNQDETNREKINQLFLAKQNSESEMVKANWWKDTAITAPILTKLKEKVFQDKPQMERDLFNTQAGHTHSQDNDDKCMTCGKWFCSLNKIIQGAK